MRYVEVRRHTMRTQPGKHLSQAGVTLARRVGADMGPFDRVITSTLPRAFETAIAMGFAVDEEIAFLAAIGDAVHAEVDWFAGFPAYGSAAAKGGATARFATRLAKRWSRLAAALSEGGCLLIISHGGIIEAGAAGCLPDADHRTWGRGLDYCEGIRLSYEGECFTDVEILRLTETPIDERIAIP